MASAPFSPLESEVYRRLAALNAANVHCQGRFEPAAVIEVAQAFDAYLHTGKNMLRAEGSTQ